MIGEEWKAATGCANGQCVEVCQKGTVDLVFVRSAPDRVLAFRPDEWAAFVEGVKRGEFDPKIR